MRQKVVKTGEMLEDEFPVGELEGDDILVYLPEDVIVSHPFGELCKALKTSQITSIDFSACELESVDMVELAEYIRDANGALTSVNCLHNPLGEGVHIIIKVFEETPRLRTLCGFEEGVEQIDWSMSRKGPVEVALLAADLKAGRAIGAVACMTLDGNKTIGATGADSLMESICTTRNTQIVKIKHDVGALQLPFQNIVVRTACQIS